MLDNESLEEEKFNAIYDGYFFEADFGMGEPVELCKDGAIIPVTKANAKEYVNLYLKAYS